MLVETTDKVRKRDEGAEEDEEWDVEKRETLMLVYRYRYFI